MDSRVIDICVKMLLEIDEIELRKEEFHIDETTWHSSRAMRDLILMPLIQIGELTTHFKNNEHVAMFPSVSWREIKGFRNVVVHGYGQIDLDIAWNAATESISGLCDALLSYDEVAVRYRDECEHAREGDPSAPDLVGLIRGMSTAKSEDESS